MRIPLSVVVTVALLSLFPGAERYFRYRRPQRDYRPRHHELGLFAVA